MIIAWAQWEKKCARISKDSFPTKTIAVRRLMRQDTDPLLRKEPSNEKPVFDENKIKKANILAV